MAMRPRGGAGRTNPPRGPARPRTSGGVWPVYQDFRPVSEWQQDDEFHILNIFLPGFTKEQIRVSTEDKNVIRARGERLVAGNKWSRFQEDFQVPENGEINGVRAKYQGGTLSITVPKKKVDNKPKATDTEKQAMTQKGKDKISEAAAGTSQTRENKDLEPPQKVSGVPEEDQKMHTTPEDPAGARRIVDGAKSTETKSSETKKTSDEQKFDHPLRDLGLEAEKIASIGLKEKRILSEKIDEGHKTRSDDNNKINKILDIGKSLPDAAVAAAKKMKAQHEDEAAGGKGSKGKQVIRSRGGDQETSTMQRLSKKMKGLTELNEERQLLVNMGVAVLVIMGLSAYVTYTFMRGQEKN